VAEGGAENQQPQAGLHHPGHEFGPVVPQLLQFDDRERADSAQSCSYPVQSVRRTDQVHLDWWVGSVN
jgi:hypothetical protein